VEIFLAGLAVVGAVAWSVGYWAVNNKLDATGWALVIALAYAPPLPSRADVIGNAQQTMHILSVAPTR
jgi:hypothetical protein